ncbi:MAG: D-alanyl-D-alanine carboxypeptidase, partial [Pseudomonadota bacterium]
AGAATARREARAPAEAGALGYAGEDRPGIGAGIGAGIAAQVLAQARASEQAPEGVAGFASGGADGMMDLKNHSGLSAASRASPLAVARLLRAAALDGEGRARAGSLEAILRPLKLEARRGEAALPDGVDGVAKTGTMNFVRGLAGYLTAGSGRRLVFAIFSEDLAARAAMRDGRATGSSRAWLSRARGLERKLVREWCATL